MAIQLIQNSDIRKTTGLSDGPTKSYTLTGAQIGATSTTYADGDMIGNPFRLGDVMKETTGYSTLQSVTIQDLTKQNSRLELVLFNANPSGTTFTDDGALTIADADLPKIAGQVVIAAGDYQSYVNNSAGTISNIGLPLKSESLKDLWGCFIARGTPTYVASELSAIISFYG